MNTEQRLKQVADSYHARGYTVVVRPGPNDLPDFAKDFTVEIVARRGDGSVLASVKKNQSDLEADPSLARYAEVANSQPGWRFDVFVLEAEIEPTSEMREAKEPTEEDIRQGLEDVERLLQSGFVPQSLIAAWSVLEAAMRRRLQAEGEKADLSTSPRTMLNELYSAGVLQGNVFRDLEGLVVA